MTNMTHGHKVVFGDRGNRTKRDIIALESVFLPEYLGDTSGIIAYILAHRYVPVSTVKPRDIITLPPSQIIGEPLVYWGNYDKNHVIFDGEYFTVYSEQS